MVIIGVASAVDALRRGATPLPGIDPREFFAIPIGALIVFPTLVGAGLLNRANGQTPKRLMLLATISLLEPAVARWPPPIVQHDAPLSFLGVTALFVVAAIAYDLVSRRRVHPLISGVAY